MMVTLLFSPLLTGRLVSSSALTALDLHSLPMPRRWWMVWLSSLLAIVGSSLENTVYAIYLGEIQTLSKISIYLSSITNLLLTLVYSVVQVGTILVSSSVLTRLMMDFDAIRTPEMTSKRFIFLCDNFEFLANKMSSLYLLFFATSSASVMVMSFSLYFYWGSISSSIFSMTIIINGILVLCHLAYIADDCHEIIRKLHIQTLGKLQYEYLNVHMYSKYQGWEITLWFFKRIAHFL